VGTADKTVPVNIASAADIAAGVVEKLLGSAVMCGNGDKSSISA